MSDELNMQMEILENELEGVQAAYEVACSRMKRNSLKSHMRRLQERIDLLKLNIAKEQCEDFFTQPV